MNVASINCPSSLCLGCISGVSAAWRADVTNAAGKTFPPSVLLWPKLSFVLSAEYFSPGVGAHLR